MLDPLTEPDWDAQVSAFPEATPFHTAAWARVLHETYGYTPLYFALFDHESQASSRKSPVRADLQLSTFDLRHSTPPSVIQPMMEVSSWASRRRGIALPFTDECGWLARAPVVGHALHDAILQHARERRWHSIEYRGDSPVAAPSTDSPPFVRHVLDLSPGIEALESGLHASNRRAIRKAGKEGVAVSFHDSVEAMRDFYRLQEFTRRRHGVPPQPWKFFAAIQRYMVATGRGFIALARLRDEVVAGTVFFVFGRWAIYKFGASDERHQRTRPNNLLMWMSIRRSVELGAGHLHLGRSATHQQGLRSFKLSWGAIESPLEYTLLSPQSARTMGHSDSAPFHERLAPVMRLLPRPVVRWLGAVLYKHIA